MTTFYNEKIHCIICNTENEVTGLSATNSFGSPDSDLRLYCISPINPQIEIQLFYNCYFVATLIQKKLNNIYTAFHLKLKAAWMCDDQNKLEVAKVARKKALRIIEKTSLEFLNKPTRTIAWHLNKQLSTTF